jgi:hypothetical protein
MSSTIAIVGKDSTFKLPQGRYKSEVVQYSVKEGGQGKGNKPIGTILFEAEVPGMENYECLARKVMPVDLKAGSPMRNFLATLLGSDYFNGKSNQAIDLRQVLVGKKCEVELVHAKHDEDRYDFPLVEIAAVHPLKPEPAKEVEPKN